MDDLISEAYHYLRVKAPCGKCDRPYLNGTSTMCAACSRQMDNPNNEHRKKKLKCDCGQIAVLVIYVKINVGGILNNIPLPVCEDCLRLEIDTVTNYL